MKFKSNFKITAPATITNIGCGLDIFGLAIDGPQDEIIVKPSESPGIHINSITNNKSNLPTSTKQNIAGITAQLVLSHLKTEHGLDKALGLSFDLIKSIPIGFGLGSSAASGVAGAMAVNEAFGNYLSKRELLPFAIKGNLITKTQPCTIATTTTLTGGLTLTRDHRTLDYHRIPVPKGLYVVAYLPLNKTQAGRQVRHDMAMPAKPPTSNQQSANAASLIHALYTSNFDLISRSLKEQTTGEHWHSSFPFYKEAKESALSNNALCCSISTYAPTVFALCKSNIDAELVAESIQRAFPNNKRNYKTYISKVNQTGASLA